MQNVTAWSVLVVGGLLTGCAPDEAVAGDGLGGTGESGATDGVADTDPDAGGDTSGAADVGGEGTADATGGADETGDAEDLPPPPATGIEIIEVTVDQAVRVPVARQGALVPGNERNQAVLKGRPAAIRAFYRVDPGYAQRTIYGILTVVQSNGRQSTYDAFTDVSEETCDQTYTYDCRYGSGIGSFLWRVFPEDIQPGAEYRVEMLETAPGHENDVSDKSPVFPSGGGTIPIGIEGQYMKMRVVLVPIYHDVGAQCADAPDLNEEFGVDYRGEPRTVAGYFGERLMAVNPVDEVEVIVHDVVNFGGDMQSFAPAAMLQQLRFEENAPPGYFYYGVGRPCQGGPDFAGVALLGGPSMSAASSRVGWGVYYANVGTTADTFVHEIGHEQGRAHIACSGEEAGVDPSYPDHPEGDTETYGIDVFADPLTIKSPAGHDYMTYCGSTWVSEWAWSKVFPWIAEISSWELGSPAPGPNERPARLLYGSVGPDGQVSHAFVVDHWVDDGKPGTQASVRFGRVGAVAVERAARWQRWEHTDAYNFVVEVPNDFESIETLRLQSPTLEIEIDRAAVQILRPEAFTLR